VGSDSDSVARAHPARGDRSPETLISSNPKTRSTGFAVLAAGWVKLVSKRLYDAVA
jgi:hypothetical protein